MSDKRDQYVKKMKAQLDEWNAEIEKLQAKAEKAEANARIEYDSQLRDLRKMRNDAQSKLSELQKAGDEAWDRLKEGFEGSWQSFQTAVNDARDAFVSRS